VTSGLNNIYRSIYAVNCMSVGLTGKNVYRIFMHYNIMPLNYILRTICMLLLHFPSPCSGPFDQRSCPCPCGPSPCPGPCGPSPCPCSLSPCPCPGPYNLSPCPGPCGLSPCPGPCGMSPC
jgi:hypothetical protein